MEYNTLIATTLLVLLASAHGQLPQLPAFESLQAESQPQDERQIGALLLGLLTPTITNILTMGVTNLASAIYNAFTSTILGKKLEIIPVEALLATPIRESVAPTLDPDAAPTVALGGQPPKRRPYTRAMFLDDDKPLDSNITKSGTS